MNKEKLRQRFLRDTLPRRLGGLAATLARLSSSARESEDQTVVLNLMDEARHLIEWTAAEVAPEIAEELVQTQRILTLWQKAWLVARPDKTQRILLSAQAKEWSERTLQASGLLN